VQSLTSVWVEPVYIGDTTGQVRLEIGMPLAILALWAFMDRVVQNRFEAIEIRPGQIGLLIDHHAGQALGLGLGAQAGFTMIDLEALLQGDGADQAL
jgi:hypothetical protein